MATYGYARVSSADQNLALQLDALGAAAATALRPRPAMPTPGPRR